jgi:hypothetical protein
MRLITSQAFVRTGGVLAMLPVELLFVPISCCKPEHATTEGIGIGGIEILPCAVPFERTAKSSIIGIPEDTRIREPMRYGLIGRLPGHDAIYRALNRE